LYSYAFALAAEVAADYPDGVYFVPLAPVRDPELVPSTIAQSLGLQDARDRPLMDHLVSQLSERQVLLVLDNFEHLLAAARRWPGCCGRPARCAS
jgi:predicted ATPase